MENKISQSDIRKYSFMALAFVISLMVMGVSLSYAYFTARVEGNESIPERQAAYLNVSSTLKGAEAITDVKLGLIEKDEYQSKIKPVSFSITNNGSPTQVDQGVGTDTTVPASTVNAKYVVKLVDVHMSKNLFSKYFKWALVKSTSEEDSEGTDIVIAEGNFANDNENEPEGVEIEVQEDGTRKVKDEDMVSEETIELMSEGDAVLLKIGETHNLKFYMWLENDPKVDQLYLTDGVFNGKLAVDAVATHDTDDAENP